MTAGSRVANIRLFQLIQHLPAWDQVIDEKDYSWIHVSYKAAGNRRLVTHLG